MKCEGLINLHVFVNGGHLLSNQQVVSCSHEDADQNDNDLAGKRSGPDPLFAPDNLTCLDACKSRLSLLIMSIHLPHFPCLQCPQFYAPIGTPKCDAASRAFLRLLALKDGSIDV